MLINNSKDVETVEIFLKPKTAKLFIRLFYSGVNICVQSGKIIKNVLVDDIGIDNGYAENRIQTVFLNAKAVDDISKAVITKNSTLALSAAMPGLVGATFRKGGYYSGFRKEVSHNDAVEKIEGEKEFITLKLFNMIARELGPLFFTNGVYVKNSDFCEIINENLEEIINGVHECKVDSQITDMKKLSEFVLKSDFLFLKLNQSKI